MRKKLTMKVNPTSDEHDDSHATISALYIEKALFVCVKPEFAVLLYSLRDMIL